MKKQDKSRVSNPTGVTSLVRRNRRLSLRIEKVFVGTSV